ncbi:MAG: hypothetical protein JWM82_3350 [Myxococcales bacterium]|nr:hypothetical protein [Myxococcales bacterium]
MSPTELKAKVEMMRELGVLECDGIKLAPIPHEVKPKAPVTDFERDELAMRRAVRKRDNLFAASSIKPVIQTKDPT